ncbi:MAG: DNA mismatch endonuclease Vsr [Deltaproteobacteria bacterium]|nr:DNA mismatch endonuclease Vsr [Deltaproteobacteria bacterium]
MRRIRSKDTSVELFVRRLIFKMGYRYRLHGKNLSGKPDLVFASRKKVIFVHGCFWHWHRNCKISRVPKSSTDYWLPKLRNNRARDILDRRRLRKMGWASLVIWECWVESPERLLRLVKDFLDTAA